MSRHLHDAASPRAARRAGSRAVNGANSRLVQMRGAAMRILVILIAVGILVWQRADAYPRIVKLTEEIRAARKVAIVRVEHYGAKRMFWREDGGPLFAFEYDMKPILFGHDEDSFMTAFWP